MAKRKEQRRRWRLVTDQDRVRISRRIADGMRVADVAREVDRSVSVIYQVIQTNGGLVRRPAVESPLRLSLDEREEISRGLAAGESARSIARRLCRAPSTVTRELTGAGGRERYRAWAGQRQAQQRRRRPRAAKLTTCGKLRSEVEDGLKQLWSPEQISRRLRKVYPDQTEMQVSHETIYQSLYVQARGALRAELAACLRTGRAVRRSQSRAQARGRIRDMVLISERPAEVEDRAVPGHWEGDLIIGKAGRSAIGTLVERSTRATMLMRLAEGYTAEAVKEALVAKIQTLPDALRRSLTWDQGTEMAQHLNFSVSTGVEVYFCDPHSPWQRGSNENTNGLLRQYFPKGTDLSVHNQEHLDFVAAERPPSQDLGLVHAH
jgi:IS30 family transposase